MDPRLIPLNGTLALLARAPGAAWPRNLAEQGFRLYLLEGGVQSDPQSLRADVIAFRTDPNLVLLFECKSGRNISASQARGYVNAVPDGLIRRGTMPPALSDSGEVAVQAVFVGRSGHAEALTESLSREQISCPLLIVGADGATLSGSGIAGLEDFDARDRKWGQPPALLRVDHESAVDEIKELLAQEILVAAAKRTDVLELAQVAARVHPYWAQVSRVTQGQFIERLKRAAQSLAQGALRNDVRYESTDAVSPRLVLSSSPAEADPRGAPQAWQRLRRRFEEALGRTQQREPEEQMSLSFEDLAADAPSDEAGEDRLDG